MIHDEITEESMPEAAISEADSPPPLEETAQVGRRRPTLRDLSPDQWKSYKAVLDWYHERAWDYRKTDLVFTLGGYAGTGKTTLLGLILEELVGRRGKSVAVVTPTGKASCVLRRKLNDAIPPAFLGTIHSFMYIPLLDDKEQLVGWGKRYFEKQGDTYVAKGGDLPKIDLIVVDESSMLNREVEEDIEAFGVPVLAVGDHGQLPPVTGRNTWMRSPRARLEKIHRQAENNPILVLATIVRETGKLPPVNNIRDVGIGYYDSIGKASDSVFDAYSRRTLHEVVMLTYTNALRCKLNSQVQEHLYGTLDPTENTQIICLRNDSQTGLINGMRGFVQDRVVKQGSFWFSSVRFPDENFVYAGKFPGVQFGMPRTLPDIETASQLLGVEIKKMRDLGALLDYGYALTVHKAQGSEFQEVFVALQRGTTASDYGRWLYTAITRASQQLSFMETFG